MRPTGWSCGALRASSLVSRKTRQVFDASSGRSARTCDLMLRRALPCTDLHRYAPICAGFRPFRADSLGVCAGSVCYPFCYRRPPGAIGTRILAHRAMASLPESSHARPWRLRPSESSGPHPHLPGQHVKPSRPRIARDDRSPRRSTRSSSTISRPSSPARRKSIPWATASRGGSKRTSAPTCAAASSPTGSPGLVARTAATSA